MPLTSPFHILYIHNVINTSYIKPYKERLLGQPVVAPDLVEVTKNQDDLYKFDYIIDL